MMTQTARVDDLVPVCLSVCAGVALSAFAGHPVLITELALALLILLMVIVLSVRDRCMVAVLMLCVCAGAFSHGASSMIGVSREWSAGGHALDRLCAFIDSIQFSSASTAPLVRSLLTGDRSGLSPEIAASFRLSGASHILALSGLHLGVIYGIVSRMLLVLGNSRRGSLLRSLVCVVSAGYYTVMTGAGPSIVRAFLFILINEVYRHMPDRVRRPVNVLCLALVVQVLVWPQVVETLGFQLSYLAMAGIVLLFPVLDGIYEGAARWDVMRRLWSMAMLSVSCQVFTAPLIWLRFHTFPRYFLLTNLLAMPLSTAIIISAVMTVCLTALGICPQFMLSLTDCLVSTLEYCLDVISSM